MTGFQKLVDIERVIVETCVRSAQWYPSIGSTNSYMLELNSREFDLPCLVGAEQQTGGRGRGQNSWWAASGSLTFTLLLEPGTWNISRSLWPSLSLATGVAVCEALAVVQPGAGPQVKWPNDVYVADRKLCGILIEAHPDDEKQLIIGIGINVNNSLKTAPDAIRDKATSLIDLYGHRFDRTSVLIAILHSLDRVLRIVGEDPAVLFERFRQLCFLTGRIITVTDVTGEVTGTCQGIDDDGALRLMTPSGPRRIFAGVVSF